MQLTMLENVVHIYWTVFSILMIVRLAVLASKTMFFLTINYIVVLVKLIIVFSKVVAKYVQYANNYI